VTESADDFRLLQAGLLDGDEAAWHLLYHRYTPGFFRLARHLLDRPEDADDVVHETWLRAARGAGRFERRSLVRTWLTGILLNCTREWRRAANRRAEVELPDDLPDCEPAAPFGVDRLDLERAIGALAPGYRQVLLLHDLEGYTHEEIAGVLGIQVGTSKSQLVRARRAVVRTLESNRSESR
jgi:RNA polymerase sigma-70 factor (ECF subfamily)